MKVCVPQSTLQSTQAIRGQCLPPPGVQKALGMFQQWITGGEQTTTQPQQLPTLIHAVPESQNIAYTQINIY